MCPVAKETSAPRNPIPAGLHQAICYGVIDLGTQPPMPGSKFDQEKHKVLFMFEFPEERIQLERDGQMRDYPRACSKEFNLSLHEKANLRKFLVGWRGRQFTGDELKGFDLKNVLGVNAMLNVSIKDNGYEDIVSAAPLRKPFERRAPENEVVLYDIDQPVPASLPEWIRKKIALSREHSSNGNGHNGTPEYDERNPPPPDDSDDLPF